MDRSLYVVDALNYLFRAFHALPPLTTTRGVPTGAVYGLCQMLLRVEREHKPDYLCAVFDAPGRTFREDLYPEYKAHRPPMPPELAAQVELVHRVIGVFGIPTMTVPGVEADDVIATLAHRGQEAGLRVVLCSSDKDLMQLCNDRVSLLDTMKNRLIGPPEVHEKFGVGPERVGDVLALMGDSIDNVPGVDGVGPKTAAELINRFGSLTELLARVAEVKGKKGEAIAAARADVEVSRKLVDLRCDVPLPATVDSLARIEPDRGALLALFRELEFHRLVTQEKLDDAASPHGPAAGAPPAAATPGFAPAAQFSLAFHTANAGAPNGDTAGSPTGLAHDQDATAGSAGGPAAEPISATGPPPVIVRDTRGLTALAATLAKAKRVGLAVLTEGGDATRAGFVGLAFALPAGDRHYLPLGHRLLGESATLREAAAFPALAPAIQDPDVAKVVHDGKLLEVMLAARGLALAGCAADTLLAAYVLDASRTRYELDVLAAAANITGVEPRSAWLGTGRTARAPGEIPIDEAARHLATEAAATLLLAEAQQSRLESAGLERLYADLELPLAHVLARIESHGVRLDSTRLQGLSEEVTGGIQALEQEIHRLAGTTFNIGSPKQLGEVLFGKLALPIIRRTKTGPSTDADVLEELAASHDVPAKILEYRTLTKLKSTYIDALPALVNPKTGRLHTTFNQAVAATGRLSSSEPNLQNIPIRTDLGRRIREAFIADPGHHIVSADYSQIELRILAHFSEDPAFLDAFRSGEDIHQRTAAEVFSVPAASVTADQRRIAKAINFGLVFGQSDFGLAQTLRIPRATAKAYITSYFERYAGVRAYMERSIAEARDTRSATTLLGRRRPIPEIDARRQQDRAHAERVARNTPIQGSAADILKLAMIRVDRGLTQHWPQARPLLTVHDELVFEVGEGDVAAFSSWVKHEMESVVTLRVPLVVDVGAGPTWGQAH